MDLVVKANIEANIARHGQHVYVIAGGASPRFAYTIGLTPKIGAELLLAGAVAYLLNDAVRILNSAGERLRAGAPRDASFSVDGCGSFALRVALQEWADLLLLGAADVYHPVQITALQVVPDSQHISIDTPDTTVPLDAHTNRAWRWLREPWVHPVPHNAEAMLDEAAWRGGVINEAARWEPDYWELLADRGDVVDQACARLLPLGVVVEHDPSLARILQLDVGESVYRDGPASPWQQRHARGSDGASE